ncbi:MAG: CHAT domain-containing protein [Bacteroidota bacterium]
MINIKKHSYPEDMLGLANLSWYNCNYDTSKYYYLRALQSRNREVKALANLGLSEFYLRANKVDESKSYFNEFEKLREEKFNEYSILLENLILLTDTGVSKDLEVVIDLLSQESSLDLRKIDYLLRYIDLFVGTRGYNEATQLIDIADEILDSKEKSLEVFRGRLHGLKGYYFYRKRDYEKSSFFYEKRLLPIIVGRKYGWSNFLYVNFLRTSCKPLMAKKEYYKALNNCLSYLNEIMTLHDKNDYRIFEMYMLISSIYSGLGNYSLSSDFSIRAGEIDLNSKNDNHKLEALILIARGLFRMKKYDQSLYYYDLAEHMQYEGFHGSVLMTEVLYYKSLVFLRKNELGKSLDYINRTLELKYRASLDDIFSPIREYITIFDILYKKGEKEKLNQVVEMLIFLLNSEVKSNNADFLNALSNVGARFSLVNKEHLLAEFLSKVISEYNDKASGEEEISIYKTKGLTKVLYLHASIFLNSKNNADSAKYFLELSESMGYQIINKFVSQQDLFEYSFHLASIYDYLIDIGMKDSKAKKERLFEYFEKSKSLALTQSLNRNTALQQSNIPDTIQLKINSLKQQDSYLTTQINKLEKKDLLSFADSSRLADFKSVLLENNVEFNSLMLYLEKNFPNYYEVNYNPQIATIESVQQNLKPNEGLLEYFVGVDGVYAFAIAKDTAQVIKMDTLSEESIKAFQSIIQPERYMTDESASYQQYINQAHELYQKYVSKPLELLEGKGINKLYIVPDKSLNYLPFELLLTSKPTSKIINYKKLDYLLNDFTISYTYSASILFRDNPMSKNRPINGQVLAVAPSYTKILNDTAQLAKLGKFRDGFEELKYNKEEVDGIGQYFDGEILKGEEATEKAFSEKFQQYDILHLAMHALVDNDDSEKSRLVFTPEEDSIYDSYLHNFELYNLNMNPKLAVLSACNTGYGSLESGEGVMSLARAFTYAGAESVVMSHWRVDDEASSIIMKTFYKYLSEGYQKDEALKLAKMAYLEKAPANAQHPFHWNNFVVIGDVNALVAKKSWYQNWWVILSLIITFIVLLYAAKRVGKKAVS